MAWFDANVAARKKDRTTYTTRRKRIATSAKNSTTWISCGIGAEDATSSATGTAPTR